MKSNDLLFMFGLKLQLDEDTEHPNCNTLNTLDFKIWQIWR